METRNHEIIYVITQETYKMLLELQSKYNIKNSKVFITKNLIHPYIRMMKVNNQEHPKRPIPQYSPKTEESKNNVTICIFLNDLEFEDYKLLLPYQFFKDYRRNRLKHSAFLTSLIIFKYKKVFEEEKKENNPIKSETYGNDDHDYTDVEFDLNSLFEEDDENGNYGV